MLVMEVGEREGGKKDLRPGEWDWVDFKVTGAQRWINIVQGDKEWSYVEEQVGHMMLLLGERL